MYVSDLDDSTPLIHNYGIPIPIRDVRRPYQKRLAVYLILTSILFERIAFYTLAANLALSLDSDKQPFWKVENASIVTFIFLGVSNISAVIFAAISDGKLGRVKTILFGFVLYAIGYLLATLFTNPEIGICPQGVFNRSTVQSPHKTSGDSCAGLIGIALIVIAIGAGSVQSNMVALGSEQIRESKLTSRFFDKYVIVVNIGAMVAMFAVPSIQTETELYYIAYLVATVMLFLAAILFLIGQRYFICVKPHDTVITKCIPVVINAFQSWYKYKKKRRLSEHELTIALKPKLANVPYGLRRQESIPDDEPRLTFLDFAKAANNGKYIDRIVNDVKSFGNALIVFFFLIPYWLIYSQINSTFRQQAQAMHRTHEYQLFIVSFIDPTTIIIVIVILNIFVCNQSNGRNWLSILIIKFVIGMFFGLITMCIAGTVEIIRQERWEEGKKESGLSIFAQIPQDITMGISESFIMVASFEFAFFSAPRSAQSLFFSFRFCSIGISSLIGAAYVTLFHDPICELDFSCRSHKEYQWSFYTYFFILGGLQLIAIPIFYICQKRLQMIKLNPQQIETNQFYRHEPM